MEGSSIITPDEPLVIINKGWLRAHQKKTTSSYNNIKLESIHARLPSRENLKAKQEKASRTKKNFEFINTFNPEQSKDPDVLKLVRTHVRNESVREARKRAMVLKHSVSKLAPEFGQTEDDGTSAPNEHASKSGEIQKSDHSRSLILLPNLGNPTALFTFDWPVDMQPQFHTLLSGYVSQAPRRLYPLESCLKSNPLRSTNWFQIAVKDNALLHAILYSGALYIALLEGKRESRDTLYHFSKVAEIVNNRLSESAHVDDTTIGAVTCLALGEALAGKPTLWKTHMLGIKQMINQRGSKTTMLPMIQAKIRRADVTGAIDYATRPLLTFTRSSTSPTWYFLPLSFRNFLTTQTTALLTQYGIHHSLLSVSVNLVLFSQTIQRASSTHHALDPHTFSEDLYFLEYQLLSFPSSLNIGEDETYLDEALRLAFLLYLKALIQEFPHSFTGPSIMLTQLQNSLSQIPIGGVSDPLLLWLAQVGGSFSSGLWEHRRWFAGYLAKLKVLLDLRDFGAENVQEMELCGLFFLRILFGNAYEELWGEVRKLEGKGELAVANGPQNR